MRRPILLLPPLLLAACQEVATEAPRCVPPPPTDMGPVGGGLSVIGLGIVVAAVVVALGEALRGPGKGGGRRG